MRPGFPPSLSSEQVEEVRELGIGIEEGAASVLGLWRESRLVVHFNDSTGFLETMALDIPTVGLWGQGTAHLTGWATRFYEELVDAGVVKTSLDDLITFLEERWGQVEDWWQGDSVVTAVSNARECLINTTRRPSIGIAQAIRPASPPGM